MCADRRPEQPPAQRSLPREPAPKRPALVAAPLSAEAARRQRYKFPRISRLGERSSRLRQTLHSEPRRSEDLPSPGDTPAIPLTEELQRVHAQVLPTIAWFHLPRPHPSSADSRFELSCRQEMKRHLC